MPSSYSHDFTENLEAVARGVRRLEEVRDPELRDAIRAALGMPPEQPVLDGVRRARMRRSVLAAEPTGPRLSDRIVAFVTVLAYPAPYVVRGLAICALFAGAVAGTAVASARSMPDDALYPVKMAAEQFRLAVAVAPADRAAVELSLAEYRLAEAQRFAENGQESGALVATSAYAAHLAAAAAELAEVDELAPRAVALVQQLEARLNDQRARAAETAQRLMNDPRTALAGVVLNAISSAPEGSGPTAAARIADSASAVTSRLAAVADDRASGGQPLAEALTEILGRTPVSGPMDEDVFEESDEAMAAEEDTTPLLVVPPSIPTSAPTAAPTAAPVAPVRTVAPTIAPAVAARTPVATATSRGTATPIAGLAGRTEQPAARTSAPRATPRATVRPTATPRATAKATPRPIATPRATVDPSARIAAQKANESAAKAKAALEKAKEAAKRTPSPKPSPKPTRTPAR